MALPTNVGTGQVIFKYLDSIGDPIAGTVTFTPEFTYLKNLLADPMPVTILPKQVVIALVEGYGSATLIATDDADNNPTGWTYKVTFALQGATLQPFSISVPEGSIQDLTEIQPVIPASGVPTIVGPQGEPGDTLLVPGTTAPEDTTKLWADTTGI